MEVIIWVIDPNIKLTTLNGVEIRTCPHLNIKLSTQKLTDKNSTNAITFIQQHLLQCQNFFSDHSSAIFDKNYLLERLRRLVLLNFWRDINLLYNIQPQQDEVNKQVSTWHHYRFVCPKLKKLGKISVCSRRTLAPIHQIGAKSPYSYSSGHM